jgi:hypothetical protein
VVGNANGYAHAAKALLYLVEHDPSLVVACEAADALIDFFSLEERDAVFRDMHVLPVLRDLHSRRLKPSMLSGLLCLHSHA